MTNCISLRMRICPRATKLNITFFSGIQKAAKEWSSYKEANALFGKAVLSLYKPGDIVWVHDYHLMLLPSILRAAYPNMKIGFFSHVPFPSSEIYRVLPYRNALLEGVLASSLIGFQTHDYLRHFKSTTIRALGSQSNQPLLFVIVHPIIIIKKLNIFSDLNICG